MSEHDYVIKILKNEVEILKEDIKSHKWWTEKTYRLQISKVQIAQLESAIKRLREEG
jgi:hypothetical protein